MLEAKVKQDVGYPVTAFSGHDYVEHEWRPVPSGSEFEARQHPMLDVREMDDELTLEESMPVFASMAAEKLAIEAGLDPAKIEGTGKDGAILAKDVKAVLVDMEEADEAQPDEE